MPNRVSRLAGCCFSAALLAFRSTLARLRAGIALRRSLATTGWRANVRLTGNVVILALLIFGLLGCVQPSRRREAKQRVKNPLETMVQAPLPVLRQEGIAAAILVDTSGSMSEKVPDLDGRPRLKIEIAQEALLRVVGQLSEFVRAHSDRRVLVAMYEFSSRDREAWCRPVIPFGAPDPQAAKNALAKLRPWGGTPIGDAMIQAKRDLDATGLSRRHLLVITDGENNRGYSPGDVAHVISLLPEEKRVGVYLVAFDVAASRFNAVRDAGGLVLAASSESDLRQTLDFVLTGKILAEQPVAQPSAR